MAESPNSDDCGGGARAPSTRTQRRAQRIVLTSLPPVGEDVDELRVFNARNHLEPSTAAQALLCAFLGERRKVLRSTLQARLIVPKPAVSSSTRSIRPLWNQADSSPLK